MGLFQRKAKVIDAEHLLREAAEEAPSGAAAAVAPAVSDFRLTVQDVFSIRGRGTVVTGTVESGSLSVGAAVVQTRDGLPVRTVHVTGIEMFRKVCDSAAAGDNVGLLLDAIGRDDVASGDVLTA